MRKIIALLGASYLDTAIAAEPIKVKDTDKYQGEEMTVYSTAAMTDRKFPDTAKATPSYMIDKADVDARVNATTVEDFMKFTPGLLIRKRFMGDPNGNLGMRGSNVFQTAHTMVFAEGIPLHNPLRTSFNGAPRWSMVSPSEVESAEVLYGPFSAQYGGGSFGGVVNLNTAMPEKFEAQMDAMGMFQDVHRSGRNETLGGYKTFISAGDKINRFSIWGSYNRFQNDGQPMTINAAGLGLPSTNRPTAFGGQGYQLPGGEPAVAYGDIGVDQESTDLFKLKMGYDFTDELQGRFTLGYEDRTGKVDDPNSLLKDAKGNTLWGGGTAPTQANPDAGGFSSNQTFFNELGQRFIVPGSVFGVSDSERQSLNYGLSLKGKISTDWSIDTTASYYDAYKDRTVTSNLNPNNPFNQNKGQVSDVDAWWAAYDFKLATDNFMGRDDLSFMSGYQFSHASLNLDVYNSNNFKGGSTDVQTTDSGGATQTNSAFSQLEWRFLPNWSVMAGGRFDYWQAMDGHVNDLLNVKPNLRRQDFADRDASRVSPKASLAYSPNGWTFRYSFTKAYRFPIAEEMFASAARLNSLTISDPGLGPENGYFHNFMTQYDIPKGYVRANFFYDQINNEIANTTQTINGQTLTTFRPIGQTETIGVDLTYQQNAVFELPVDVMVNGIFMNKQITENPLNPSLVGNEWDRIPKLQVNASVTYHILPVWDSSVAVRYRSDSFQRLDNTDTAAHVMGVTDESTFVDLKTSYQLPINPKLKSTISAGIDNVFDYNAFENHPYPQRTYFVKVSLKY
jgi:iron complex outermembrane receptor protein